VASNKKRSSVVGIVDAQLRILRHTRTHIVHLNLLCGNYRTELVASAFECSRINESLPARKSRQILFGHESHQVGAVIEHGHLHSRPRRGDVRAQAERADRLDPSPDETTSACASRSG